MKDHIMRVVDICKENNVVCGHPHVDTENVDWIVRGRLPLLDGGTNHILRGPSEEPAAHRPSVALLEPFGGAVSDIRPSLSRVTWRIQRFTPSLSDRHESCPMGGHDGDSNTGYFHPRSRGFRGACGAVRRRQ